MDGELGIYNKMGGGEKYKKILMGGGSNENDKNTEEIKRIKKLEEKISIYQKELDRLKKNLKEKKYSNV